MRICTGISPEESADPEKKQPEKKMQDRHESTRSGLPQIQIPGFPELFCGGLFFAFFIRMHRKWVGTRGQFRELYIALGERPC